MGFRGILESQNENRKKVIENYKSKQMFRKVERKEKEEGKERERRGHK